MLRQGQVVLVTLADPRGQNPKTRPAVILTATEEILADRDFVVAAVSTTFDDLLPDDSIPLPWSRSGSARTGLLKPSVVKCRWLKKVRQSDIKDVIGFVPAPHMLRIIAAVNKLL